MPVPSKPQKTFLQILASIWRKHTGSIIGGALLGGGGVLALLKFSLKRLPRVDLPVFRGASAAAASSSSSSSAAQRQRVAVDAKFFERFRTILRILFPSWRCMEVVDLLVLTALLLARTMLSIHLAEVVGQSAKVLVDRKLGKFVRMVLQLGAVAVPASITNSGLKYFTNVLAMRFRRRLSSYLHQRYLDNLTYYKAASAVDNCDQRITEDVAKFCDTLSDLYSTTFKPVVDLVLFTYKLSRVVGWQGPAAMIGYYIVSAAVLRGLMPSFARLTSQQQHLEGTFRSAHSRLLVNAEEISFLNGARQERNIISAVFNATCQHTLAIYRRQAGTNVADGLLVKYGASVVGYAVCAIPVFSARWQAAQSGLSEADLTAELTKNYVRDSRLLISLAYAIGQIVLLYKKVTALAGYTSRVAELLELLGALQKSSNKPVEIKRVIGQAEGSGALVVKSVPASAESGTPAPAPADVDLSADVPRPGVLIEADFVRFEHVDIVTPDGTLLARDLNFQVMPGDNLLVTGPNGCGKSSMFRVLGELWPLQCGRLFKPAVQHLFYVPQKPYLALGTLRDQVIYPHARPQMMLKGVKDEDIIALLRDVQLSNLVERSPQGLDDRQDWSEVLSAGEKQRIAMARLYYHRPQYAILDECTSTVSLDVEHQLYTRCKEMGCTLITISHRRSLWKFHKTLMAFDGRGNYSTRPITAEDLVDIV